MTGIRKITVETIPHNSQRYDTVGDWVIVGDTLTLLTSDLGDWRMSMACALHEAAEAMLCLQDGVNEPDISAFDIAYEDARQHGVAAPCGCVPTVDSEPGEDRHAPYRTQHAFADGIERLFANQIGVVWDEYSERVTNSEYRPHDPFEENGELSEDADDQG
jgi:hypothetical protein